MSYYTDKQYSQELPLNAVKDLEILFFNSFLKDSRKILDIGCSNGRVIAIDPKRIEGIDMDKKALRIARNKNFKVSYGDITKKLPFKDESFDAVYFSQVIEHLNNPLYAMQEIRRILKKKGRLVLITLDYLKTYNLDDGGFYSDYTHKTPFVKSSLKRLAYNTGFKQFRIYHFPGKGLRNLMRLGLLSKETWIKLEKLSLVWVGQDLVLEAVKS